ncbi:MAG: hypothetical protein K6G50_05410 [bacterium]|nr:hypothetical protein [bacterium]
MSSLRSKFYWKILARYGISEDSWRYFQHFVQTVEKFGYYVWKDDGSPCLEPELTFQQGLIRWIIGQNREPFVLMSRAARAGHAEAKRYLELLMREGVSDVDYGPEEPYISDNKLDVIIARMLSKAA